MTRSYIVPVHARRTWHHGYDLGNADTFVWKPSPLLMQPQKPRVMPGSTSMNPPWRVARPFSMPSKPHAPSKPHVFDGANPSPYAMRDDLEKLQKQQRRISILEAQLKAAREKHSQRFSQTQDSARMVAPDAKDRLVSRYDGWTRMEEAATSTPASEAPLVPVAPAVAPADHAPRPRRPATAGPLRAHFAAPEPEAANKPRAARPQSAGAAGFGRMRDSSDEHEGAASPTKPAEWPRAQPDPTIMRHLSGAAAADSPRLHQLMRTGHQRLAMTSHSPRFADGRDTVYASSYCRPPELQLPKSSALEAAYHPSSHNSRSLVKPRQHKRPASAPAAERVPLAAAA